MPEAVDLGSVADSFLRNYYQAKNFKEQRKQRQSDLIIQAALSQLNDPTIPLKRRNDIFNAVVEQAGGKKGVDHAGSIGLRALESENVQVGSNNKTVPTLIGSAPNPDQTQTVIGNKPNSTNLTNVVDKSNPDFGTGGLDLKQETIGAPPVGIYGSKNVETPIYKKRGDLSPLDLQTLAKEASDNREYKKELDKILLARRLNPNYKPYVNTTTKELLLIDEDNPNNNINLGKDIVPASVYSSEQKALLPKGKLAERLQFNSTKLGKPINDPEVIAAAENDLNEAFQADLIYKKNVGGVAGQTYSGTREIQPDQTADNQRADLAREQDDRDKASKIYNDYIGAEAARTSSHNLVASIKGQLDNLQQIKSTKTNELQQLTDAGINPTNAKYKLKQSELNQATKAYNDKEEDLNKAKDAEDKATEAMKGHINRAKFYPKYFKFDTSMSDLPRLYPNIDETPTNIQGYTDKNGKTYGGGEAYVVDDKAGLPEGQSLTADAQQIVDSIKAQRPNETKGHSDWEIWLDYRNRSKK